MQKHGWIILLATVALGVAVAAFVGRGVSNECLTLADHTAQAGAIRGAAKSADKDDQDLCEGLALLAERKGAPASKKLATAMAGSAPEDRWSVQGYYARALALAGRNDLALRNWNEAIAAGANTDNVDRANIFRGDRGVLFGMRKEYRAALADFETVYRTTSYKEVRGAVAYNAFKVVFLDEDRKAIEHWYPLAFDALAEVGDAEKLAYATEVYGQLLDEREEFDASAALYRKALAATDGWGNEYWHAELLEFAGQSRFAAGDFEGGERFYRDSAAMFRRAGEPEYAAQMDSNRKARVARRDFEAEAS
jgi:tetratricopeptide (TPR) repeat protein